MQIYLHTPDFRKSLVRLPLAGNMNQELGSNVFIQPMKFIKREKNQGNGSTSSYSLWPLMGSNTKPNCLRLFVLMESASRKMILLIMRSRDIAQKNALIMQMGRCMHISSSLRKIPTRKRVKPFA